MSVWNVIKLIYGNDKVIKFFVLYLFCDRKVERKFYGRIHYHEEGSVELPWGVLCVF